MAQQDVSINIKANTQEAIKNLRMMEQRIAQMEKKSDKLGNMEQQGTFVQKGFITPKQVMLYKNLLKEMAQLHNTNIETMSRAEKKLSDLQEDNHIKRLKQLEDEIQKRQVQYTSASARGANPIVQDFYQRKLSQAREEYDSIEGSSEYRELIKSQEVLEESIRDLAKRIENSNTEMDIAQQHGANIGNLNVKDSYNAKMVEGAGTLAQMAMPMGLVGGGLYLKDGVSKLREQERMAWQSSQKMDAFNGTGQHDEDLRQDIMKVGIENNYSALETGGLLSTLISGGTQGDVEGRKKDINSVQEFSRANAVDSNLVGSLGAEFQKLGSLTEGNLNTYTERIAGAIEKSGMQGREEEMLRSNLALVSSVSQGLSGVSEERVTDLTGLQSMLSEAIPSLSGDRGAEVLGNMDSSIKNGDNSFDLIMGKGIRPEFSGMMGSFKLQRLKEQGLTSEALKYYMDGLDAYYGGVSDPAVKHELQGATFVEHFQGTSMEMWDKLNESGMIDKIKSGQNMDKELRSLGEGSISKGLDNYLESSTSEVDSMNAWSENRPAEAAQGIDEADKGVRGAFNSLPEWMQTGAVMGSMFGGGMLMQKAIPWVMKKVTPKASTYPKGGGLSRLWDGAKGLGSKAVGGLRGLGSGADDVLKGTGGKMLAETGGSLLKGAGKAIPLVGGLATVGIDQATTDNSWGKSLAKGAGSVIGGGLGLLGAGALGLSTGGVGFLGAGAMTMGGSMAGEKVGSGIYDFFTGGKDDEDIVSSKDLDSNVDKMLKKEKQEHVVKVQVDGSIKGMNATNEDKVADGIKDYFTKLVKKGDINLSVSQTRG